LKSIEVIPEFLLLGEKSWEGMIIALN
jgi:hypothetical protein